MAEELQGLLDRIQKDGIDKADAEASRIVEDAKRVAAETLKQAETQVEALLDKAREEGKLYQERGESAISQAARDVILSVGDAVTAALQGIVSTRVDEALSTEDFAALVKQVVLAYCSDSSESKIDVILSETQREAVNAFFMREMSEQMQSGLTIKGDRSVVSGFIVSIKDAGVYHDFTGATLTDALCSLLRPQLAEIVKQAMPRKTDA
jgi:V/A-type H+/Na+-transporting ATPase subunit E